MKGFIIPQISFSPFPSVLENFDNGFFDESCCDFHDNRKRRSLLSDFEDVFLRACTPTDYCRNRRLEDRNTKKKTHLEKTGNTDQASTSQEKEMCTKSASLEDRQVCKAVARKPVIFPLLSEAFNGVLRMAEDEGPFEVSLDVSNYDPKSLKIEFKNGQLVVEGKSKSDNHESYFCHKRSTPVGIEPSSLEASVLPNGVLKIRQMRTSSSKVPIEIQEEEKSPEAVEVSTIDES